MATATKKCRVCGSEYEACHTLRRVEGIFRWQDVACCPEHGAIYLARIEASRAKEPVKKSARILKPIQEHIELPAVVKNEQESEKELETNKTEE